MADLNIGFSAVATGTADVITATYSPAITLSDRRIVFLHTSTPNTNTTPTFNPNALGAQLIKSKSGGALKIGEIVGDCILMYHTSGTYWELLNSTPFLDATSSIQTQLNGKQNASTALKIIQKTAQDGTSVTGTLAETITYSFEIPANTFTVNDIPEFSFRIVFTGTAGAKRVNARLHTSNAVGGTLIANFLSTNTALSADMARRLAIKSATVTEVYNGSTSISSLLADSVSASAVTQVNMDWTASVWIIVTVTLANATDAGELSFFKLTN